jgi:polar amino acid transport system substrate-binding protein
VSNETNSAKTRIFKLENTKKKLQEETMKKAAILCVYLFCCFFISTVYGEGPLFEIQTGGSPVLQRIKDSKLMRVGINPHFKPFSFIDQESKERVGVDIDLANRLANQLGVTCKTVVPTQFSDLIPMLQKGHIDIIMADMSKTFARSKAISFSDAYFKTGLSIMINKVQAGKDHIPMNLSYQAFKNKLQQHGKEKDLIIALTRGKAPARIVPRFFAKAKLRFYNTNEKAAQAVLDGRAHIMIHDELFLKVWVNDHRKKTLYKVEVFPEPFKVDYYAFAIQKGNQEWLNMVNVFIMELKTTNHFNKLLDKYMK